MSSPWHNEMVLCICEGLGFQTYGYFLGRLAQRIDKNWSAWRMDNHHRSFKTDGEVHQVTSSTRQDLIVHFGGVSKHYSRPLDFKLGDNFLWRKCSVWQCFKVIRLYTTENGIKPAPCRPMQSSSCYSYMYIMQKCVRFVDGILMRAIIIKDVVLSIVV